ncbi:unnamed protein product, partial [Discosporangium mesarthrocarpum]
CLRLWLQQQQTCPTCRAEIPRETTPPQVAQAAAAAAAAARAAGGAGRE